MIAFHTSTLSHIGDSNVTSTSANASASNTDVVGPRFATQSTIGGVSRTKVSSLRFATESEWCDVGALDGAKAEPERTSYEA